MKNDKELIHKICEILSDRPIWDMSGAEERIAETLVNSGYLKYDIIPSDNNTFRAINSYSITNQEEG